MNNPMSGARGAVEAAAGGRSGKPGMTSRSKSGSGGVGNERKADTKGAQMGGSAAEAKGTRGALSEATAHLRSEHPTKHDDIGPHHGGNDHVRHSPAVAPNRGHPYG